MQKQGPKLLIFDGISGVPMARELHESFGRLGIETIYLDAQSLSKKPFFKIRGKIAKPLHKLRHKDGFYYFPKASEEGLSRVLACEQPNILLVVGFLYRFVAPEFVRKLKDQMGFSLYLYDTDSCNFYSRRREFIAFIEDELTIYDRIFSFSKVTTDFFRKVRQLNASYLPFGARPIPFGTPARDAIEVLFVGSADLRRVFLLEKIQEHVRVFGKRWERHKPLMSPGLQSRVTSTPVWESELHDLLLQSKIVLNITRSAFFGAETGLNLRLFEALAAGCFLLTDHCDELEEIFEIGAEIETYRSSEELKEKVAYYLEHDEKRLQIARRGHEKFLRSFSWDQRVKELWRSIATKA